MNYGRPADPPSGSRRPRADPLWDDASPIRAELFSAERLEAHARTLALAQDGGRSGRGRPLERRLAANEKLLLQAYRSTVSALEEGAAITPAAEWLIDNFHVLEKQIREVRLDLPPSYYRQLPKIAEGHLAGYPRVFGIAWAYVAHTDSQFDCDLLCRFMRAYQEIEPLEIGELWAVAITLRIVLIENLRRIAQRILVSSEARRDADCRCDRMLGTGGRPPEPASAVLADKTGELADAFVVQVCQRLRDHETAMAPALSWLEARLTGQGRSAEGVLREEQQRQVAASLTVRNIITSLRLISDVDWPELVERVSLVDDVLRQGSAFADMDFPTRNLYRNAVEALARGSGLTERAVAERVVDAIRAAGDAGADDRTADPGFYLVAEGRHRFEAEIGFRPRVRQRPARMIRRIGIAGYGAAVFLTAALLLTGAGVLLGLAGVAAPWLALLGVLGAIPAIDAAVAFVNRGVTRGFRARPLPALELRAGVPSRLRTVVAVPVMLRKLSCVEEQVERLEIHYLASPEGHLHFALLSDWADAAEAEMAGDQALLDAARAAIARLNRKYGPAPGGDRFLLLHRRRVWSQSEGCWMGWERKRGKLHELNRLLRGAEDTTFLGQADPSVSIPRDVRYVVTLDADTKLPRETVRRLIGKMAHPLNRARFDASAGRVVAGYGILQPRITPAFPVGGPGSLFQRVFSSMGGIDPYASAVSDVYQDLFGEGSYAGKGIYDIDAFEAALKDRVPESALLSHDLFEGIFARAGLASDVEVVEEFPDRYDVSAVRHHRWARGDWQLLPWMFGIGRGQSPGRGGGIPAIGRWKMLDNLRRSLSPIAGLASLAAGWLLLPLAASALWTGFILFTFAAPPLIPVASALTSRRIGVPWRARLQFLGADLKLALLQAGLVAAFLAHQAWLMSDAVARTFWRLFVSRRLLLQWTPAAHAGDGLRFDLAGFYARMVSGPLLGGVLLVGLWVARPEGWLLAAPFAALWIASPAIALQVSRRPAAAGQRAASDAERAELRLIGRRTWRFFETFLTADDNDLPPDNYQEDPAAVAHRTSPTNIGLYLLSVASARDFGWIGTAEAVQRLEATFATLNRLDRFRGHFYNWYDTRDLRPLEPHYVSSVDSGNLAGHLIALANGLETWREGPLAGAGRLAGIADALELAREAADAIGADEPTLTPTARRLQEALDLLGEALAKPSAADSDLAQRLEDLAGRAQSLVLAAEALAIAANTGDGGDLVFWAEAVERAVLSHRKDFDRRVSDQAMGLARRARALALEMEFGFLLDVDRMLLSIGYRASDGALDPSCYDLLGSEARLASFFAIAKGDAPPRHWFRLGHAVTPVANGAALISWSGSMFEYLMPSLVMRAPADSLLEQTNRLVVRRQIEHAAALGVPWGISESAYNVRDLELTYQYLSFGVPNLGLKRGLADHVVIAPYATALAAMVDPKAAVANFAELTALGALGRYGYYEAIDFTPGRVPDGERGAIVRAFMAHHQGMTIVAIANALSDGAVRERFHAEPMIQANELLLEERMPRLVAVTQPWVAPTRSLAKAQEVEASGVRRIETPHTATPAVHLLSNGSYSVMLTAAGGGYSRWRDMAVTRWREDATCDGYGAFIYLRDVRTGEVWSAASQPTGVKPDVYAAVFNEERCEISRRDGSLTTALEVLVSGDDDAEVRRISISNEGFAAREIDVTSYAELVLAPQAADVAHPAFSKLFVETEHLPSIGALVASRRRRAPSEPEVWAAHLAVVEGEAIGRPEFESDRAQFLGRGRDARAPSRVAEGRSLSGTTGTVLDPIFALRRRIRIEPGGTARISFWTLLAPSRQALMDLIDKHHDPAAFERASALAWTQALVQLHHLGIDRGEAALFQRLASHLIYAGPEMRAPGPSATGGQPGLWRVGVSGDLPILVLRIGEMQHLHVARQVLRACEYWRAKQLAFDLVILNERATSYVQDLQVELESLVRASQSRAPVAEHSPGGRTVVLRADLIATETRDLLVAAARVVLPAQDGGLGEQLDRRGLGEVGTPPERRIREPAAPADSPPADLEYFNGLGGFAKDGREYVVVLAPGQDTPAPWINVVANPNFGFQTSAEGAGYTWRGNSREHQLTPWPNDPVSNPSGEAFYIRDDDTGELWSPTVWPIRHEAVTYIARHGWGYSRFGCAPPGLELELIQFVPAADPVKLSRLRVKNTSSRIRRLTVAAYVEWVLGASRAAAAPFTVTELDAATGAVLARNDWNPAFGPATAFFDLAGAQSSWTGDRREFIGRNGRLSEPAALVHAAPLSGRLGPALDPCAAQQTEIELAPGEARDILVLLGEAESDARAQALVRTYRAADFDRTLAEVSRQWDDILGVVQVRTPDRSLDLMLNGWLLYQTLACRIWARCGFYQASGAYGFRDQLQDGMALAAIAPALTREHLLRAAARQFVEGDVQHWWLPHSGQGVRTRISDDRVWLAYATAHYVETTGDGAVLDEVVPFLSAPPLEPGEAERFLQPEVAGETGNLFEHCARALDCSLEFGGHGLPLFGAGDWNDGMNRVGERGLGESVWLGWMLHAALSGFIPVAEAREERARAASWRAHAEALEVALERSAWDGEWYRRGWFDDGTPLGSAASEECRIDSIAQSWAVISGAANPERAAKAMAAAMRELTLEDEKLALLFAPPFNRTALDPGYIKGYPPGVRENGGQYTHAAAWSVIALARLGEGDRAAALLAMLNPINHARTRAAAHRYKVEPYVAAADVYAAPGHVGRGGWTWYTGSAGWLHRAGLEALLGIRRRGATLIIDPCVPADWDGFEVVVRCGASRYQIVVTNPNRTMRGIARAELDGQEIASRPAALALVDDGQVHRVDIVLGEADLAPRAAAGARERSAS